MKAIIGDSSTEIYLTGDEFKELCKPGQGAETCIWAVVGANGFECCFHNKPFSLVDRREAGLTVAKRDGCEKVRSMSFLGAKTREMEF